MKVIRRRRRRPWRTGTKFSINSTCTEGARGRLGEEKQEAKKERKQEAKQEAKKERKQERKKERIQEEDKY